MNAGTIPPITTSSSRHLLLRLNDPARLPDALLEALRQEVVLAGWFRASGVLEEVRIRAVGGDGARRIAGTVQAVVLEGSVGLSDGDVTCGLRAVLAREADAGLETIAGEIVSARVTALEVMITALDDVTVARQATPAGVWLMEPGAPEEDAAPPVAAPPVAVLAAPPPSAPEPAPPAVPKPSPTFSAPAGIPPRPDKPRVEEEEQVYPNAGDVVEHFAFGRCEVVKSDGDRLHLRLGKDGRIREIALEMLKVTPLPPAEGAAGRHFKLDRKL